MPLGLKLFRKVEMQSLTQLDIHSLIPVNQIVVNQLKLSHGGRILNTEVKADCLICHTTPFDITESHTISYLDIDYSIQPAGVLDTFVSEKPLGCIMSENQTCFRVFAPRAGRVTLELYKTHDSDSPLCFSMNQDANGIWEIELEGMYASHYYGYRVEGPKGNQEEFDAGVLIGDPYSKAVVTGNHYLHPAKTLILPSFPFNWEGDTWLRRKTSDLIIYELHVRDMSQHWSSGVREEWRGRYPGLTDPDAPGGLNYLKKLGINAVELLPIQEFSNYEVDYKNKKAKVYNTWNPYARNHWGYMTSYYFAPESYYATGNSLEPGGYCGASGNAIDEMKQMVKVLHQHEISVIMDVVYNHVSQYDQNPFKFIDKKYYFRLDDEEEYLSDSYCGNDFKTERPMARRLIVDSLKYWMTEFHVDGFRFDLAAMIDVETLDSISRELREINPDVILIAEPWGGNQYDLRRFSIRGWSSWNDQFRNGIKGHNAHDGLGYIMGHWHDPDDWTALKRYMLGSVEKENGPFVKSGHSVNYLESHDDITLGDFVRIGTREFNPDKPVRDLSGHVKLTPLQVSIHKLAAMTLLTSQGCVMMHAGQEFARSQVIAPTTVPDAKVGFIDHDTYNKDDETNWINYDHAKINQTLVNYYQGLIAIRKKYSILRSHDPQKIYCWGSFNTMGFAMHLVDRDRTDVLVLLNSHRIEPSGFDLPKGKWALIADEATAGLEKINRNFSGHVEVPPVSGLILIKENTTII